MQNRESHFEIIEAPVEIDHIRTTYDRMSKIYSLFAPLEATARMRGIELASIQPDDRVLEVAVGVGRSFLEILKRIKRAGTAYGVDLSPMMLEKTRQYVSSRGFSNFKLKEADARQLPFADESFDVLYNSFMLDLIPISDFSRVLGEFRRVLKKDGRLVLVNMSAKKSIPESVQRLYAKIYKASPYIWGGCRPVFMKSFAAEAGFRNVQREVPKTFYPAEIVTATK